jgi:predicted phage-related endonuclease
MTAVELAKTLDMPREEWLVLRRKGIGGSDAGHRSLENSNGCLAREDG